MPDKPSIAFVGRAGSGKTSAAGFLTAEHGFARLSFAGALKQCAQRIWGQDVITNRGIMQDFGTAVRRVDEDAWVNALVESIKGFRISRLEVPQITVDDCRFWNEYYKLRELGFVFARVEADEDVRVERLLLNNKLQDREQLNHVSETESDDFPCDYIIENNGNSLRVFNGDVDLALAHAEAQV